MAHNHSGDAPELTVVGGGLAGCEAAWQAAQRGVNVTLYEMRPFQMTGAHLTGQLAELVCSNSLGSGLPDRASGLLQAELSHFGSLLLCCAHETALPAGSALAVDREAFAAKVTAAIENHPQIKIIREELTVIPAGPAVIATGPLTSPAFAQAIHTITGQDSLYFYDAVAPIVSEETIDMTVAFRASRYGRGESEEGDYINCPFNREQYQSFVEEIRRADRIPLREFEMLLSSPESQGVRAGAARFFEGCLPVEIIARRGPDALAFGPMRPVGIRNSHTGTYPYAVVQLRQDNLAGTLYNLVGFQTNLTYPEQKRVFRLIPGLEQVEFVRYGQMHRNTFIASPVLLEPTLQLKTRPDLFFAGQITGVEGYMGNIATGLLAGINAANFLRGSHSLVLPQTTMLGALCYYITHAEMQDFQPMKANYGLLPPLNEVFHQKRERNAAYSRRSLSDLKALVQPR